MKRHRTANLNSPPLLQEHLQLCALICVSLAADTAVRLGLASQDIYETVANNLPHHVRTKMERSQRCTVSWLTDTGSLMLMKHVLVNRDLRPGTLLATALFCTVCPNWRNFKAMGLHQLATTDAGLSASEFVQRFRDMGSHRPLIPQSLWLGMQVALNRCQGRTQEEKASNFAEHLSDVAPKLACMIQEYLDFVSTNGDTVVALEDAHRNLVNAIATTTKMPWFRVVMFLRFLSLSHPELYSWKRFDPGWGATIGLDEWVDWERLHADGITSMPKDMKENLARHVAHCLAMEVRKIDHHQVVATLEAWGIDILQPANTEHLLCETRKVTRPRNMPRGEPFEGYCHIFYEISDFLREAHSAHFPAKPMQTTSDNCEVETASTDCAAGDANCAESAIGDSQPCACASAWPKWTIQRTPAAWQHSPHAAKIKELYAMYRRLFHSHTYQLKQRPAKLKVLNDLRAEATKSIETAQVHFQSMRAMVTMAVVSDVTEAAEEIRELALRIYGVAGNTKDVVATLVEDPE